MEIGSQELNSICRIIDYFEEIALDDYEETEDGDKDNHVYNDIKLIIEWLNSVNNSETD